jgi:hypothetical protein
VPTAKQAVRGRFLRLSWPHLLVLLVFVSTLFRVVQERLLRPEEVYTFSPEAVWGMVAFASIPVLGSIGGVYAAWQSRRVVPGAPWDEVDVDRIGGDR